MRLTVKRVERAAEASGAAQAAAVRDRSALIAGRKLVPMPPRPVPDMLYGVIDGTGVPMTAKETAGRDGKGEDGRARTREVKLAVFFTQDKLDKDGYPVRDRDSSSYIATFEPASVVRGPGEGRRHPPRRRARPAADHHRRRRRLDLLSRRRDSRSYSGAAVIPAVFGPGPLRGGFRDAGRDNQRRSRKSMMSSGGR